MVVDLTHQYRMDEGIMVLPNEFICETSLSQRSTRKPINKSKCFRTFSKVAKGSRS
ncbi:hypothetical protein BDZ94DRAFT_1269380 [Collybia nuda]|uniref:Uncharacterized protein n=1 Tax=Collybia nuda TaxID=64659 RepID=A0A9P5Y0J5_9AGAR|nr:hypothetical protein BDZ94DRAFT_1269380 [Collybia nuda]